MPNTKKDLSRLDGRVKSDKKIHADSKNAKEHGKKLVREEGILNLDASHKDWYNQNQMAKQRKKPKYIPSDEKKLKKDWKN